MDADVVIDRIAAGQHGIVTRHQLLAAGVSRRAIDRRIQAGRLRTLHRGVFQAGGAVGARARELAAVLACGHAAVLSHESAAALWALVTPVAGRPLEVSTPAEVRRRLPGVIAHRVALAASDVTVHEGVPVTAPARTLLDLALTLSGAELERAIARGFRAGLLQVSELAAAAAVSRHHGGQRMHALLNSVPDPSLTRSEAEARLLDLIRRARLPQPRVNAPLHGYEVDFVWPAERLVVEVDGYAYHAPAHAFERDRQRDARLTAQGLRVIRLTWKDIVQRPEATVVILAQALARG